jgi:hypothetical protein
MLAGVGGGRGCWPGRTVRSRAMDDEPPPLDLSRPRSVGELLSTTVDLFVRHTGLFLSVTLLVVAPYVVLVDGVWGRALRDGPRAQPGPTAGNVSLLLAVFVIPPLVTGLHAVIVRGMGAGHVPTVGRALRDVAPRLPAAFGAVALYTLGVFGGLLLLVVPGIWLGVRWYFAAQTAVLDETAPRASVWRSAELVQGSWWQVLGALIVNGIIFNGAALLAHVALRRLHAPLAYVVLHTLVQATALSLTALFGTLLFFTLRAQRTAPALPAMP